MIVKCCASCRHFHMDDFDYGCCEKLDVVVMAEELPCLSYEQCKEEDLPEAYDLLDEVCNNEQEEE